MLCPKCGYKITEGAIAGALGKIGGSKSSAKKTEAARRNILKRWENNRKQKSMSKGMK